MKIEYVSITNHALKRWIERVGNNDEKEIIEFIKKSKVIDKKDLFVTKAKNTTYLKYEDNVIVLKPEDEEGRYAFVTIIKNDFKEKKGFRSYCKRPTNKSEKKEKPRNCKRKKLGREVPPEISEFYE